MRPINALHYAENGVHQCWSCQNCVGKGDAELHMHDINFIQTTIRIVLPVCKHTNEYMQWVRSVPCEKYIPDCEVNMKEEEA